MDTATLIRETESFKAHAAYTLFRAGQVLQMMGEANGAIPEVFDSKPLEGLKALKGSEISQNSVRIMMRLLTQCTRPEIVDHVLDLAKKKYLRNVESLANSVPPHLLAGPVKRTGELVDFMIETAQNATKQAFVQPSAEELESVVTTVRNVTLVHELGMIAGRSGPGMEAMEIIQDMYMICSIYEPRLMQIQFPNPEDRAPVNTSMYELLELYRKADPKDMFD